MTLSDTHDGDTVFSPSLKFWITLLAFATIFWLGGFAARSLVGNEFFVTGTLEYSPTISLDQERTLFQLIYAGTFVVLISYVVVLVSMIMITRKIPLRMKDNGWLLMAAILFFLFIPVEIFTGYLDVKFILLWATTKDTLQTQGLQVYEQHSTIMRETLSHRIGALGGLPVIATLCYFTAIVISIWQPMKRRAIKAGAASDAQAGHA
jgi:hypothetical protein